MNQLDAALIETALRNMFAGSHFNICVIREIVAVTKSVPPPGLMGRLSLLHCVNWEDMTPDVREALPDMIREAIGSPPFDFESIFQRARAPAQPSAKVIDLTPEPTERKRGLLGLFK